MKPVYIIVASSQERPTYCHVCTDDNEVINEVFFMLREMKFSMDEIDIYTATEIELFMELRKIRDEKAES